MDAGQQEQKPTEVLRNLTPTVTREDLLQMQKEVEAVARSNGLDFSPVIYEPVSVRELNIIAARDGFPTRYPHWRFALEADKLNKSYEYQGSKIYELVVNTEPVVAYLLSSNSALEQKLVMAHVCGHADFFKNNLFFAHTNRKMLDQMGNHSTRIRQHMDLHGVDTVERWIDTCRSLENLIAPFPQPARSSAAVQSEKAQWSYPPFPQRDALRFLIEHANLEDWQRDVLSIVRDEAYYFLPQAQTKIMNEGWAAYWHAKLMTAEMLVPSEIVDYCDRHSSVVHAMPGQINPYRLGIELFRDIEERTNLAGGDGRTKIFEVRASHNDITFLDHFLTKDFAERRGLISYEKDEDTPQKREQVFKDVKDKILETLTNRGQPILSIVNANHNGRGELYLKHDTDGRELDLEKARATMENLSKIWGKQVHLETVREKKRVILSCQGKLHLQKEL